MTTASARPIATFPKSRTLRNPTDSFDVSVPLSPEFLQHVTGQLVGQAFPPHEVFHAKTTDSIAYVFSMLIEKRIMAMPIIDSNSGKYVAWVDIMDVLIFVVRRLGYPNSHTSLQLESWITSTDFMTLPCSNLFGVAKRNVWVSVNQTDTVKHLMHVMGGWNVHRVAVVDSRNRLTNVVTMSGVCRWIQNHKAALGNAGTTTLQQLKLGYKDIVAIEHHKLAMDAFAIIANTPVGGVAVLDDDGQLIGNISANDFKEIGWGAQMFAKLYLNCKQFIELRRYSDFRPHAITISPQSTFNELVAEFNKYKVHRIYLVEQVGGDSILEGVIALGDVILLLDHALRTGT